MERSHEEYWEGWPRRVDQRGAQFAATVKAVEEQFKVVLVDMNGNSKWKIGEGLSCIKYCASDGVYYEKYDAEGRLVKISGCRSDFEELKAVDERREELLKVERDAWATAKGITYEDAMSRSNEWLNVIYLGSRPRLGGLRQPGGSGTGLLGGSLRARRLRRQQETAAVAAIREELAAKDAERQALAEQENAQRTAERAEQRQQLLAMQEELKRVREARSAAKTEAIER